MVAQFHPATCTMCCVYSFRLDDTGEMIHGSVDTLPYKGHKRMFFINARRSLLAQGGINDII